MFIFSILQQALTITVFVLVMMIVIEYVTIRQNNRPKKKLPSNFFMQILFAVFMGLIPGCLGTYAVVSMYIHGSLSLAALSAAFVATSGDEAFIMFSMIPNAALKIIGFTAVFAIITGLLTHYISKGRMYKGASANYSAVHSEKNKCAAHNFAILPQQLKKMSLARILILLFGIVFLLLLIFAGDGHEHAFSLVEHSENHHEHGTWGWERVVFLIVSLIGLFIALTVTDHFLEKHLWGHVIKKHFFKLLIWTFATFFVLHFLNKYVDLKEIIRGNVYLVLFIAALIGLFPESGPHIIFISMFASGIIPFPVLLSNSIVQDGHGSIPLLAESPKSFVLVKFINFIAGLVVGYLFLLIV